MLEMMRNLALLDLNRRFNHDGFTLEQLRREHSAEIAPLLVEAAEKIKRVYLLQSVDGQPERVRMWSEELDEDKRRLLPFNKPSGAQSAAIGPVIKRTYKAKDNPPYGPTLKIQNTSREAFVKLSQSDEPWSDYFGEVCSTWFQADTLCYQGNDYAVGEDQPDIHILSAALHLIPDKETVFVGFVDSADHWPGKRSEYHAYLARMLADIKYITGAAPAFEPDDCPLCGAAATRLYPNAVKGAGLNFGNPDRAGAFSGLDTAQAWKNYGLCLDCADLLYIFKNHLLDQFIGRIAGDKALLLPDLLGDSNAQQQFIEDWRRYIRQLDANTIEDLERDLMEFFSDCDDAQLVLHILWAKFGQLLEDVSAYITDVLPSRLQTLSQHNLQASNWPHALAPAQLTDEICFDLSLSILQPLLRRPGGKRSEKANASPQLFALKRQLCEALYHGTPLGSTAPGFWREIIITGRSYLDEISASGSDYGLLRESNKHLTLVGWVRHLARFLYYLDITGVLPMETTASASAAFTFEPQSERLRVFLQPGSGINSREKAFAFMLGILYGKLLQVQSARGVNVAANALTWLKRLQLSGRDLPTLYNKIREKLLSYDTESSADVRTLIQDIGRLGALLGDSIRLDATATCYFLLLGQSVAIDVLPSKPKKGDDS